MPQPSGAPTAAIRALNAPSPIVFHICTAGGGMFAPPAAPGQVLSPADQDKLKLTPEQKKQLAELQKQVDSQIDTLLKDEQKKQLKDIQDMFKGFAGGPPGGGPPGGGFPGFGGGGGSGIFRAPRYAPDFAGFKDKVLKPGKTIEELEAKAPPKDPKDK